jgi:hypothetical protein
VDAIEGKSLLLASAWVMRAKRKTEGWKMLLKTAAWGSVRMTREALG